MGRPGQRLSKLSSQIFLYQLLILTATLLIGFGLALNAAQGRLDDEYEQRALAVARSVAATPEIARALEQADRSGIVQARAERVRRETGTSFVVVADANGIRYSHPNPANIGRRVSTPPDALSGHTVLAVESGTLGRSARAKVPLRASDGTIVGQVSVGVLEDSVRDKLGTLIPAIALYTGIALLAGLGASLLLARRLKRQTFGLELRELAELLQEREAMLHGVREGVVAVDPGGRIRVVNAQARRLLDLPDDVVDRRPVEAVGPGRLAELLEGRIAGDDDLLLVHGERVLVANRMPVRHQQRDLGAVITLRDRTELEGLVRELGSVRDLTDAMRAQAHEFSNRMHTVSGLLELGHYDEAIGFVKATTAADTEFRRSLEQRIADPVIAALLLAKSAVSSERGVTLRLTEDTVVPHELSDARAVLTVLGNLIDNALDAARWGTDSHPWVEVDLKLERDDALLHRRRRLRARRRAGRARTGVRARLDHETLEQARRTRRRPLTRAPPRRAPRRRRVGVRRSPRRSNLSRAPAGPAADRGAPRARRGHAVIRTLIVEDDFRVAKVHVGFTERVSGFEVVGTAHTAAAALAAVSERRPDLLLLDIYLPDASGLELLRRVTLLSEPPDVIMLTAASDMASVRAAVRGGAVAYLIKPFDAETLADRLKAYADLRAHRSTDRQADQAEVDRLFGLSAQRTRRAPALPKGHSAATAELILDALATTAGPLSARQVAERVGVSRATAQRYLSLLSDTGQVDAAPLRKRRAPRAPV